MFNRLQYDIDTRMLHISTYSHEIRVSVTYLITITLINNRKIDIQMRLSFLVFTEIAKLNTREIFCNQQIAKLDTHNMLFFSNHEIKHPRNLIPLRHVK